MRLGLGIGFGRQGGASRSLADYAYNGTNPAFVADFGNEWYYTNGAETDFATIFTTNVGSTITGGELVIDSGAGDDTRIPAAQLPFSATAMTIHIEGRVTYSDSDSSTEGQFIYWQASASERIWLYLATNGALTGRTQVFNQGNGVTVALLVDPPQLTAGADRALSMASRHTASEVNGALNGTAETADATPTAMPAVSGAQMRLGVSGNGMVLKIARLRIWTADLGDAGIAAITT